MKPELRPYGGVGLFFVFLTIMTGVVYSVLQFKLNGEVRDPFYIGLLMSSCMIIYRSLFTTKEKLLNLDLQGELKPHQLDLECLAIDVFRKRHCSIGGFIFFLVFSLGLYSALPW